MTTLVQRYVQICWCPPSQTPHEARAPTFALQKPSHRSPALLFDSFQLAVVSCEVVVGAAGETTKLVATVAGMAAVVVVEHGPVVERGIEFAAADTDELAADAQVAVVVQLLLAGNCADSDKHSTDYTEVEHTGVKVKRVADTSVVDEQEEVVDMVVDTADTAATTSHTDPDTHLPDGDKLAEGAVVEADTV